MIYKCHRQLSTIYHFPFSTYNAEKKYLFIPSLSAQMEQNSKTQKKNENYQLKLFSIDFPFSKEFRRCGMSMSKWIDSWWRSQKNVHKIDQTSNSTQQKRFHVIWEISFPHIVLAGEINKFYFITRAHRRRAAITTIAATKIGIGDLVKFKLKSFEIRCKFLMIVRRFTSNNWIYDGNYLESRCIVKRKIITILKWFFFTLLRV